MNYYYADQNNQPQGPVTIEHLVNLLDTGVLHSQSPVIPEGGQQWQSLIDVIPTVKPNTRTSRLAVCSLVMGILGMIGVFLLPLFPLFPSLAIICGHIALIKIRNYAQLSGKKIALTGLILGYVSVIIGIAVMVCYFGFIGLALIADSTMKIKAAESDIKRAGLICFMVSNDQNGRYSDSLGQALSSSGEKLSDDKNTDDYVFLGKGFDAATDENWILLYLKNPVKGKYIVYTVGNSVIDLDQDEFKQRLRMQGARVP